VTDLRRREAPAEAPAEACCSLLRTTGAPAPPSTTVAPSSGGSHSGALAAPRRRLRRIPGVPAPAAGPAPPLQPITSAANPDAPRAGGTPTSNDAPPVFLKPRHRDSCPQPPAPSPNRYTPASPLYPLALAGLAYPRRRRPARLYLSPAPGRRPQRQHIPARPPGRQQTTRLACPPPPSNSAQASSLVLSAPIRGPPKPQTRRISTWSCQSQPPPGPSSSGFPTPVKSARGVGPFSTSPWRDRRRDSYDIVQVVVVGPRPVDCAVLHLTARQPVPPPPRRPLPVVRNPSPELGTRSPLIRLGCQVRPAAGRAILGGPAAVLARPQTQEICRWQNRARR